MFIADGQISHSTEKLFINIPGIVEDLTAVNFALCTIVADLAADLLFLVSLYKIRCLSIIGIHHSLQKIFTALDPLFDSNREL